MRGQIRKRGKSWAVIVYLGREPQSGKERRKWYTHKTQREAETHLAQLLVQIQGGAGVPPTRLLTGEFLKQWLRDNGPIAPTTASIYEYQVRKNLVPALGHLPLTRLSPPAIQGRLNAMLGQGLAPATVHQAYRVLNTALSTAVRWGMLLRNPCEHVKAPRVDVRPATIWDEEQVRLFLAEAKRSSPYYRLYLTIILTGARPGEVLAIKWRYVNLTMGAE